MTRYAVFYAPKLDATRFGREEIYEKAERMRKELRAKHEKEWQQLEAHRRFIIICLKVQQFALYIRAFARYFELVN